MNFGKQILVSFVLVYLISLLFTCETSFLGFELDLLTHEFLVNSICWRSTLRNPWYSYFSSIYFSYSDFCSFLSGCSYPETPDITPDTPDHQTRSIRAYTRSIRASLCLIFLLSVLNCRLPIHPPSWHLKIISIGIRAWLSIQGLNRPERSRCRMMKRIW